MTDVNQKTLLAQISAGRTDAVFEFPESNEEMLNHCAYYGDVTAVRYLLERGGKLESLGGNLGLGAAAFHGHWRLCLFLLERGAQVNFAEEKTGETALHAALCTTDRAAHDRVIEVLLRHGADPNLATLSGIETGAFMRDCRTKGETALHRAAAFGEEATVRMLLEGGANREARDAYGDTPLCWASWYLRPAPILRLLLYGEFRIHPKNRSMRANLIGGLA